MKPISGNLFLYKQRYIYYAVQGRANSHSWILKELETGHMPLHAVLFSLFHPKKSHDFSPFKRSCLLARSHAIRLVPQGYWLNESSQHILLYIRRRLRLIYGCVCELTCSQVCDCSCLISVGTWYLSVTVHYDI